MPRQPNRVITLTVEEFGENSDETSGPDNQHVKALFTSVLLQTVKDVLLPDRNCSILTSAGRENFTAKVDARNFFFSPKEEFEEERRYVIEDMLGLPDANNVVRVVRGFVDEKKTWSDVRDLLDKVKVPLSRCIVN